MTEFVEAAGGIVMRRGMILMVHRMGRGWELPKGRQEPGETLQQTALREVREETGYACVLLGEPLPPIEFTSGRGQKKRVHFWRMVVEGIVTGQPPDSAIDASMWCKPHEVFMRLRHDHERDLIQDHIMGDIG
jgi:8-oxo-dGTP pyrophosphatase MutT (NUDIX family)